VKLLLSLILVICSSVSFSQNAEDVLKSLQNKFDSISDLSVDVSQSSENSGSLSGKMFFKKENKLKIEFPNQTIVTDGKTSWNYNKKSKKVIISDYEDTGSGLLSINYLVYQYPSECNVSLTKEGGSNVLLLKSKTKKNNLGDVQLFINKDNLIDKAVLNNPGTGKSEVKFSNYKLNQKISESNFTFTAPEGTTVVDLR
jgi:outer membrane lipoprotein-sorting protein